MGKEDYKLRLYRDSDYDQVLGELTTKKYLNKYLNKGLLYSALSFFGLHKSTLYVLEGSEGIVGRGVIRQKFSFKTFRVEYWLRGLEVLERHRGKGLGMLLQELTMDMLKEKNVDRVFGTIRKDNIRSFNLHSKLGFVKYKEYPNDYDVVCYLK